LIGQSKRRRHLVRDYLTYVAIGVLVAIGAIGFGIYSAIRGVAPTFKNDWMVTIVTAAVAFGYVLKDGNLKHDIRFWSIWSFLPLLHFVIFLQVFSRIQKVPLIWSAALSPAELIALEHLLTWASTRDKRQHL